ncbi:hypothetical protein [[Phormidium] sp. LEGE 05292]|uniref:hypothetical protein n=1 Tax=[Phormidium] sp. LEGE 05292 TaxID=767427 RepID=UPI001D15C604|nr:hypothetical protein [Phormidium sp. LEGE 05292]
MVNNSQTEDQDNPKQPQKENLKQKNVCGDALNNACESFQCGSDLTDTSCNLLDCANGVDCGSGFHHCGSLDCGSCGNCVDCGSGFDCSSLDCGSCGSCGS